MGKRTRPELRKELLRPLTGTTGALGFQNDADGNTLSGNGRTSAWDSQNRLVSSIIGGNTSTYKYGADGLRRQKTTNGATTDYAYDGSMMVREGHASGGSLTPATVTATYFQGVQGPCYRRDDTQTESDGQGRTVTKARWYVYDGLGSVVGEVDPLGNLTSSPKYDVYGAVRSNAGTASTRHGFVGGLGHVSDTETGLVYVRARYYDPNVGRFLSEDPDAHGKNWFIYCNDNPTNYVDKTGKDPIDDWNQLEQWAVNNPIAGGMLGSALFALALKVASTLPAMAVMAKETIGMGLLLVADAMISGGRSLMGKGAVDLTVFGIASTASEEGEIVALGKAMQGATEGFAGASELAAGIALQSVAEFILYS